MKTSKPIATISYNSKAYLENLIEELKDEGTIEYAMWIYHDPEGDDNKKYHYHVYLKPAQMIQTTYIEERFRRELDPAWKPKEEYKDEEEKKAHEKRMYLGCTNFRVSKEDDWLLYAIHDPAYLVEKGLEKEVVYSFEDVKSTCPDTLQDIISHMSDNRKGRLEYRIIQCVNLGMNWNQIVCSGIIPLRHMAGAKLLYQALTNQSNIV